MSRQTRRQFLKAAGLTLATTMIAGCEESMMTSSNDKRPNIIFIMADDHDRDAMSCYGSRINKTPNIDRIANEGMLFENCFCTNSICEPSRAVILTGKYSHINGVTDNLTKFDASQQTFTKLLQKAGYETAMIGKWHLKSWPTGFDYWKILPGQGDYYNPKFNEMGDTKRHIGYVTDLITDFALDWLKKRNSGKPFCLMYHHKAPHREWEPNLKHLTLYDDVEIPEPDTFNDDYSTRSDAAREQEMTILHHLNAGDLKLNERKNLTDEQKKIWDAYYDPIKEEYKKADLKGQALKKWKYQRYIKDYLRCVKSVDENVGRVLDYLDKTGQADNTIIIYTSDQGFYLGTHGWFDKRFMYEESHHMPFVIRYPKEIKPGSKTKDMILNLDFAPTFLDYAGVKKPSDIQGESIRPVLQGNTPDDWRQSVYYHYYEFPMVHMVKRHYGVRTQRYKLIHFYFDIDAWELYDLEKDPNELNNVCDDPAYASVVKDLKKELQRLRDYYGDSDEHTQQDIERFRKRFPKLFEKLKNK